MPFRWSEEKPEHEEHRTWDGLPISPDPPYGAAVVVYRREGGRVLYLVLHRAHFPPEFAGDWAWGPPSGARLPGEPIDACARRELWEEAGLELPLTRIGDPADDWVVYVAEAPAGAQVRLSPEHDRCEWVPAREAARRCLPSVVAEQIRRAARIVEGEPAAHEPGGEGVGRRGQNGLTQHDGDRLCS